MPLVWELTRGSCSSAWATTNCICDAGSLTPLRCSRWRPRPGRRSTRSNWKGEPVYRQWDGEAEENDTYLPEFLRWLQMRLWAIYLWVRRVHIVLELWLTVVGLGVSCNGSLRILLAHICVVCSPVCSFKSWFFKEPCAWSHCVLLCWGPIPWERFSCLWSVLDCGVVGS